MSKCKRVAGLKHIKSRGPWRKYTYTPHANFNFNFELYTHTYIKPKLGFPPSTRNRLIPYFP